MKTRRISRDTISPGSCLRNGINCIRAAGAESQKVIGSSRSMATNRAGSRISSSAATRIEPPAARIPNMS